MPVSETEQSDADDPSPETVIVEGYGVAAAASLMVIEPVLQNVRGAGLA
jgi:hypothetical protein